MDVLALEQQVQSVQRRLDAIIVAADASLAQLATRRHLRARVREGARRRAHAMQVPSSPQAAIAVSPSARPVRLTAPQSLASS
ncbi:MAG: hypothetical protein QOE90_1923 [Thermoplasmata archaeon]|nr:hypothetical protein [Thermoplasmata archaeon]